MTAVVVESAKRVWDGDKEKLLNFLAGELDDEVREEVLEKVNRLFKGAEGDVKVKVEEKEEAETLQEKPSPVKRELDRSQVEEVLPLLREYFGISATMVAEDAFEDSQGDVERFLQFILGEVEEGEREELEKKLRALLEGS